jgi:predicted metal-dependent enzyme (double-stranded beta helix superfamily)
MRLCSGLSYPHFVAERKYFSLRRQKAQFSSRPDRHRLQLRKPFARVCGHHLPRLESGQHHPVEERTAILQRLSETNQSLVDRYLVSARETLARLVATPGLLDNITLERAPAGYARNLIFGDDQMSAWALVWSPGARTPIHDHHCSCCFAILSGTIREIRFNAVDDHRATKAAEHIRTPGFVASMMPSGPNIHQMINDGPQDAISIHIYGYDHRMFSSSVHREYRQIEN